MVADQCAAAPGADAKAVQASSSASALAKTLVERARGRKKPEQYWEMSDGRLASGDDITAVVIYLSKGKDYSVQMAGQKESTSNQEGKKTNKRK